ncbi:hypothetical protein AC579_10346 [Pseudocercospora musae]|uniref:Hydrophobin n=1 Tax=Pseudocercospora musae TaxID=113226 RepID=A0A139ICR5_9PEZI|nr:hypothetical protein AC579_10346 [Pseudocercospora musae]
MRFFSLAAATFALASAAPVEDNANNQAGFPGGRGGNFVSRGGFGGFPGGQPRPLCQGLQTAQCCQLDVAGLVAATCKPVPGDPFDKQSFTQACASTGLSPQCCVAPAAGAALLCNSP